MEFDKLMLLSCDLRLGYTTTAILNKCLGARKHQIELNHILFS